MNTPRAFLGVATLDNTIYAVGGYNEQDSFLDSVEYYSPTLRTWQYARRLNVARASLGLCTLQNRLIAVGGENRAVPNLPDQSPIYLNSVEVFDRVRATAGHGMTSRWDSHARSDGGGTCGWWWWRGTDVEHVAHGFRDEHAQVLHRARCRRHVGAGYRRL